MSLSSEEKKAVDFSTAEAHFASYSKLYQEYLIKWGQHNVTHNPDEAIAS